MQPNPAQPSPKKTFITPSPYCLYNLVFITCLIIALASSSISALALLEWASLIATSNLKKKTFFDCLAFT